MILRLFSRAASVLVAAFLLATAAALPVSAAPPLPTSPAVEQAAEGESSAEGGAVRSAEGVPVDGVTAAGEASLEDADDAETAREEAAAQRARIEAEVALPPDPADTVRDRFAPPPGAIRLSKNGRLWVDKQGKQVLVDGYVAMDRGMLEMFACPAGTKEHESVVAVLARSRDVHTALLAVGAQSGTPVQYAPKFVSATGQSIRVWVLWYDEERRLQKSDARKWVVKTGTKQTLKPDWVFAGSNFWKDPADGQVYYEADAGDLICVSNFSSAMMDVPVASSKDTGQLLFSAAQGVVPPDGTPVRLVLIPIPPPVDDPESLPPQADPDQPPADKWLSLRKPQEASPGQTDKAAPAADSKTEPDAAGTQAEPETQAETGTRS
ncbi:YdjY domain-containing protein [Roseimaritima sediminicola]|uniref:YdjY domain-containing protein n=1 Tax=Roseimaritima sediminicola TaxID=2662066 RepID=UPI0012983BB6|nr:YdjY domain-containing protein [Roseimaritima sediminicola]